MPTIAFVSRKGGVGKTTSALLLAHGLVQRGLGVSLIDSDPNLPLKAWADLSPPIAALHLFHAASFQDLPGALRSAQDTADWVVVDTEGGAPRMGGVAITHADLVITPLAASQLEIREARNAASIVEEVARRERRPIRFTCLFARTPSAQRRSFREAQEELRRAGLPVLRTALTDKEAFRSLFSRGGTLEGLRLHRISGLSSARDLVSAYADEVISLVSEPG